MSVVMKPCLSKVIFDRLHLAAFHDSPPESLKGVQVGFMRARSGFWGRIEAGLHNPGTC